MHLSGPIEQIYTHNEMSFVFNFGLITPLHKIVYLFFPLIFKISLIFMKMQMKVFSNRSTGFKNLSKCITDFIKKNWQQWWFENVLG